MRRRTLFGAACGALLAPAAAIAATTEEVDLLLVLAADVSQSMQPQELSLQREGYVEALRHPAVLSAIGSGPLGAIGLTYIEWSGALDQRVLVPWTRLANEEDGAAFAERLAEAPQRAGDWTSISAAIAAGRRQLAEAPFRAARRVIDISGDGENNHGGPPAPERDRAVAEGITLNGLPILREGSSLAPAGNPGETRLEEHYRREVVGGFGSFVLPTRGFDAFAQGIRRKMVLEIAGLTPGGAAPA